MKEYVDKTQLEERISFIDSKKKDSSEVPFSFGIDSNGKYGYKKQGSNTIIPFKTMQKVGALDVDYQTHSINLSAYPGLTSSEIFLVPHSFSIRDISDDTATEGTIPIQTCTITKTFSNGVLSVIRTSLQGTTGVILHCDVYIYY